MNHETIALLASASCRPYITGERGDRYDGIRQRDFLAIAVEAGALVYVPTGQQQQQQQQQQQDFILDASSVSYEKLRDRVVHHEAYARVTALEKRLPRGTQKLRFLTAFSLTFFQEIRDTVCGKEASKLADVGGLPARGLATGAAAWLMGSFGLANPVALGIAATVLFVLAGASKGAFCKMTREDVLKSFGVAPAVPPANKP